MREPVSIAVAAPTTTKTGKTYVRVETPSGERFSIWDAQVGMQAQAAAGQMVDCEVDRTGQFAKITAVYGPTASGAVAVPAPAAPPAAPQQRTTTSHGGGRDFKKDPVGILLSAREKALGCAIAAVADTQPVDHPQILKLSELFEAHLLRGLGSEIDLPKSVVFPGQASQPAKAAVPASSSDDDIPF